MKKIDIENAFMNIYPSQSLKTKVAALEENEIMQTGRKQNHRLPAAIPISIAAALAVILAVFGGYSLLSRGNIKPDVLQNPQNTQSVNTAQTGITTQNVKSTAAFLVKVYAANGTATELSKDSTTLMAYSEPGLPIMLESLDHRATQYEVSVNQGTIWTGEGTGLQARGTSCVLAAEDKLYWSAQTSDGTYVKSAVISIAAYSGETLIGEIVVTIRRGDGKDYDARVVEGVAQNVNADGSITLEGKITDNVYVNTVVTGLTDLGAKTADICRVQLYPVLKAPYITMFGADRTVAEHKTYNNAPAINGTRYPVDQYTYTNGDELSVNGDGAYFGTRNGGKLNASIRSFYPGFGAIDKDWDFASREEAYDQIKSVFSKLGIAISDQYDVYTYDYESLKKIEQDSRELSNPQPIKNDTESILASDEDWSEEDNCYYFVLQQELNGMPVTKRDNAYFTSETNITYGPTLEILYTKNGIEMLGIMDPYEVKTVEQSTAVISLEDAMKAFGNFCTQIEGGSIRTIIGISYEYVPFAKDTNGKNGYDLVPCWTLQVSGGLRNEWYFINAVTSECYKAEEVCYG